MDIKNILNDAERRASAPAPASLTHSPTLPTPAQPDDLPPLPHPPSTIPLPHAASAPTAPSYAFMPPPPQQIVYTGPVYQLPPAVEVRHLGNAIHYRYAPYAPYEDAQHVDYAVYQEYAEVAHPHAPAAARYPSPSSRLPEQPALPSERRERRDARLASPGPLRRECERPHPDDPHVSRLVSVEGGYEFHSASPYHAAPSTPPRATQSHRGRAPHPYQFSPDERAARRSASRHSYARQAQIDRRLSAHSDHYASPPHSRYASRRGEQYLSYIPYPTPYSNVPQYTSSEVEDYHANLELQHQRMSALYNGPERYRRRKAQLAQDEESSVGKIISSKTAVRSSMKEEDTVEGGSGSTFRKKGHSRKRERARMLQRHSDSRDELPTRTVHNDSASEEEPSPRSLPHSAHDRSSTSPVALKCETSLTRMDSKNAHRNKSKMRKSDALPHMSRKRRIMEASYENPVDSEGGEVQNGIGSKPEFSKLEDVLQERLYGELQSPNRDKAKSSVSPEDSLRVPDTEEDDRDGNVADIGETSSGNDSDAERGRDDESGNCSEQDLPLKRPRSRVMESLFRKRPPIRIPDPDEPYPQVTSAFSGIPPSAVGDLLQLWEFVTAFSKTLRLTSFSLRHLEQAIVHDDRSSLLDACLIRLVQAILSDGDLVDELDISESVVRKLTAKNSKNLIATVLDELPRILSFESDEVDDHFLHSTVHKLAEATNKWAFYKEIGPAARLRVLRELVDYATMTDILRECVTDSMDHAEEEKKKAREENSANRKKLELLIRNLRAELLEFRSKNGLLDSVPDSEGERTGGSVSKDKSPSTENAEVPSEKEEVLSRQEKLLAAQKERKEVEERRIKEREAEAIASRIDKVRANLKTLKNIRLRNRTSSHARDEGTMNGSIPSPQVPLRARHEDPVRTYPVGTDRNNRCYWFFQGSGRIWIEDTETGTWSTISRKDDLNMLMKWLSAGRREEVALKKNFERRMDAIVGEMTIEAKVVELAEIEAQETQESGLENVARTTRAGKRKANNETHKTKVAKSKKTKLTGTFADYQNLEK